MRRLLPALALALLSACDSPDPQVQVVESAAKDPEPPKPLVQEEDSWTDPEELLEETGDTGDDTGETTPEEDPPEVEETAEEETEEPLVCDLDAALAGEEAATEPAEACTFDCQVAHAANWQSTQCDLQACTNNCTAEYVTAEIDANVDAGCYEDRADRMEYIECEADYYAKRAECYATAALLGCNELPVTCGWQSGCS